MKIKIIGSGITGITTAYYLAKNNHQVTIADERRYPAMATSYANGCQISASNSETWNSWKNVRQASKWILKKDAPLLISLRPELNKIKWFIKFINSISQRKNNTLETCKMALNSSKLYKIIAATTNNKPKTYLDLHKDLILLRFLIILYIIIKNSQNKIIKLD